MYQTNYFSQTKVQSVESILPHIGFNNMFPTVQETNHFTEVGWLKKNEMHGVKDVLNTEISFGILYMFK